MVPSKIALWRIEKYHEVNIKNSIFIAKNGKYCQKRQFSFLLIQQFIGKKLSFLTILVKKSNNCRFCLKFPTDVGW